MSFESVVNQLFSPPLPLVVVFDKCLIFLYKNMGILLTIYLIGTPSLNPLLGNWSYSPWVPQLLPASLCHGDS